MDSHPDINRNISGADLRGARKAAKLTQADLAKRIGVSRDTVQYWEAKQAIGWHGAWRLMAEALGLQHSRPSNARAGGWGVSFREQADAQAEVLFAAYLARSKAREAQSLARLRVICGAKTRKGGQCRNKSEPGKRRYKFHGGKSTGAKTPDGLARIAEAQRQRWARVKALVRQTAGNSWTRCNGPLANPALIGSCKKRAGFRPTTRPPGDGVKHSGAVVPKAAFAPFCLIGGDIRRDGTEA